MNPPVSPTTLLFAGESLSVKFNDGSTASIRVRALPARHLHEYLDLRDVGRESELLAKVVQRSATAAPADAPAEFPGWAPADSAFIDNLSDESHVALLDLADKLNRFRAISQAER